MSLWIECGLFPTPSVFFKSTVSVPLLNVHLISCVIFYVAGGSGSSVFALYTTSVINVSSNAYYFSVLFCLIWWIFCSLSDIFQQPVLFIVHLCWVLPLTCRITIGTLHKLQTSTAPTAKSINRSHLKALLLLICWTYSSVQAWAMLSLEAACLNRAHPKL